MTEIVALNLLLDGGEQRREETGIKVYRATEAFSF
jgi:hypothetical protein